MSDTLCKTCAAGYYLLSGYCDHCNSVQEGSTPDVMQKRIAELERELAALKGFLEQEGYRRCDIPACNCDSYHKVK